MGIIKRIGSMERETRTIIRESEKVTEKIRFALISDLHSSGYGEGQSELVKAVKENMPDVILYAGDIFDSRQNDERTKELFEGLSDIMSFFVTGNHEMKHTDGDRNRAAARSYGITVLQGEEKTAVIRGQKIAFCGVDDSYDGEEEFLNQIERIKDTAESCYRVFMIHNPEKESVHGYVTADLTVSGHVHGGQWRLPFVNRGLVSPRKTLFPKYCSGLYKIRNGNLVVSRGLSKTSTRIPRIFNRPEVVFIDLLPSHENIQK